MKAIVTIIDYVDEGRIIGTRISDNWFLFISDYDGQEYYVNPDIVEFLNAIN